MSAGTLALLHIKGWRVSIATMTPGDCGSAKYRREDISRIRCAEATEAAALLDGTYHCLGCDDAFVMYDRPTLLRAIELLRKVRPTVVFAPSPSDYMADHEVTSALIQTACFVCGMPNIQTPGEEPFEKIPYLYYVDPVEGMDKLGNLIEPSVLVDITEMMETKEKMLCCHASQREWLMAHHGMDEYVESMKRFARKRGERIGCRYAEGFRQHLGHPFPKDSILKTELGKLVH
jgi:LmbE family N-acetylglucosaminyl deacetylase